jgi:hypothetical protein
MPFLLVWDGPRTEKGINPARGPSAEVELFDAAPVGAA